MQVNSFARKATRLALLLLAFGSGALAVHGQPLTFQKASGPDDSIDDVLSGTPPSRNCPLLCRRAHFLLRLVNCSSADVDGNCLGPSPTAVTGGHLIDSPPVAALPLDCTTGVTVSGTGTSDPATCDPVTNTVDVRNVAIPPGGNVIVSFWTEITCTEGVPRNLATFDWNENPSPGTPLSAVDPVANTTGLLFRVSSPRLSAPQKDAPSLPVHPGTPYLVSGWGLSTHWVISGQSTDCVPQQTEIVMDKADPAGCMTVDCSSLRLYLDDVPTPLPPGTLCPDPSTPADWSLGSLVLQPGERIRIEFDVTFTSDHSVTTCCNLGTFKYVGYPEFYTVPTRNSRHTNPDPTCVQLDLVVASRLDAVKIAEDAAGNEIHSIQPGGDVYWHFIATDQGASNIVFDLNDDFPPAAVLDPGSIVSPFPTGTCTITGQHLTCTGVSVPGMGSTEMKVRTRIDCNQVSGFDQVCNEAVLTGSIPPPVWTRCPTCAPSDTGGDGNRTCVTVDGPNFDFASKTATDASGNGLVAASEVVHYRVTALNSGTVPATGVVVADPLPAGASFVPGTLVLDGTPLTDAADGDAGEVVGGVVTVRIPSVPVLTSAVGVITFDARCDTPTGAQLCNAATIQWAEEAPCGLPPKSLPPACLDYEPVVTPPSLSFIKSVAPIGTVDPGATLTYSLGVCDGAAAGAGTGLVVTDVIPAQATYVPGSLTLDGAPLTDAADADAGAYQVTPGPEIVVSEGGIAPGQCHAVTFQVTVDAGATGSVDNAGTVTADGLAPASSNTVSTPVRGQGNPPQLSLSKGSAVVGGGTLTVGSTLIYTLHACNAAGAGPATNVVVTDAVPTDAVTACGTAYVAGSLTVAGVPQTDAADTDAGQYVPAPPPGSVEVLLPTLDPGQCVDVTFQVTVGATCANGDTVDNTASLAADGVAAMPSNSTSDVVGVVPPPNPNLLRRVGGPLVSRCPTLSGRCDCELGPTLDAVADDCVTAGTCAQLTLTTWTVPGELQRRVPLVFYEVDGAACLALGDATHLTVTKSPPSDVAISLVP